MPLENMAAVLDAVEKYLRTTLECVRCHDNFDVLGHLTYACKSPNNPIGKTVPYRDVADVADEIMKCLVAKGKGMEINTSGVDRTGDFLPPKEFLIIYTLYKCLEVFVVSLQEIWCV